MNMCSVRVPEADGDMEITYIDVELVREFSNAGGYNLPNDVLIDY